MKKFILLFFVFFACGCQPQDTIYSYQEVRIKSPQEKMTMPKMQMENDFHSSIVKSTLDWVVPEGWVEEKGSGMRMATLRKDINDDSIEMSVIELSGPAGGVEANLQRWCGQIGITSPSAVSTLISNAQSLILTDSLNANIYDYSVFVSDPQDTVIIAAIINLESSNIFIKITTQQMKLDIIRDDFISFVESIRLNK